MDAEKPRRRCRKQPVDRTLNVRAHMTGELPRGRDQLIVRNAGEMPGERVAGAFELLGGRDFGEGSRDLVQAVIADQRHRPFKGIPVLAGKRAAELAMLVGQLAVLRNRLAGDQERMSGSPDASPGRRKQLVGTLARIGPAQRLAIFFDFFQQSGGVGCRLLEYRMQQVDDEFLRRFIVVVKDYLKETGLGLNIAHEIISVTGCCFGVSFRSVDRDRDQPRTNQEHSHAPQRVKLVPQVILPASVAPGGG